MKKDKGTVKKCFIYFLFFVSLFCTAAENETAIGKKILNEAFGRANEFELEGVVKNPVMDLLKSVNKYVHPGEITKLYLYKKKRNEKTADYRADLFDKNDVCVASVIQNAEGKFIVFRNDKYAFRCLGATFQNCMEHLYLPIQERELDNSEYDVQEVFYLGEKCWKILISVPQNMNNSKLKWLFGDLFWCKIPLKRPFMREYIIGKNSGIILSKKLFNFDGSMDYSFEYSSFSTAPTWDGNEYLFHTPKNILGTVYSEYSAFSIVYGLEHPIKRKSSSSVLLRYFSDMTKYISESLTQQICLLVGIGVSFVGAGVWIRMRRK